MALLTLLSQLIAPTAVDAAKPIPAPGAISGLVWWDLHGNGIRDSTTHLFERVPVMIDMETPTGLRQVGKGRTDRDGAYRFDDLTPGRYRVRFDPDAGYQFATSHQGIDPAIDSDVTAPAEGATALLTVGDAELTNIDAGIIVDLESADDFPKRDLGSVESTVFHDVDEDGVPDADEHGEPLVRALLWSQFEELAGEVQTDRRGRVSFGDLVPGTYLLQVVAPEGLGFGPNSGVDQDGWSGALVVPPGGSVAHDPIGLVSTTGQVSVGGIVFGDANNDGVQGAGEIGLAGLTVEATVNGVTSSVVTDEVGAFHVSQDVPLGSEHEWTVRVTDPSETYVTGADTGFDDDGTQTFPATPGTPTTVTAPMVRLVLIGGQAFHDLEATGIMNLLEEPLAGVTVSADPDDVGLDTLTTTTEADGRWSLEVRPGGSTLTAVADGFTHSPVDQVADDMDSDIPAEGLHIVVPTDGTIFDVGMWGPASVRGVLWDDLDGDGQREEGEPLRGDGELVELLDDFDGTVADSMPTVGGTYEFLDVRPGNYRVRFPTGTPTQANQGDDATDSDVTLVGFPVATVETAPFNLVSLETDDYDAGYLEVTEPPPPTGVGTVDITFYWDANANEALDADDLLFQNAAVRNPDTGETLTSNAADATVTMVLPAGDWDLDAWSLTLGTVIHGAGWTNGETTVSVVDGQTTELNALGITSASLSIVSFEDRLADGFEDSGDPLLPGVELFGSGPASFAATTNASGDAEFIDQSGNVVTTYQLPPGDYLVTSAKTGYVQSPAPGVPSFTDRNEIPAGGATISLVAGSGRRLVHAGLFRDVTITGEVWEDTNHDDLKDGGESPEPRRDNVLVELLDEHGVATGHSIRTDAEGAYSFTVAPGRYQLRFEAGPFVAHTVVETTRNSDVTDLEGGTTDVFPAGSGETVRRDAGYHPTVLLSGILRDSSGAAVTDGQLAIDSPCGNEQTGTDETGSWSIRATNCFDGVATVLRISTLAGQVPGAFQGFNQDGEKVVHLADDQDFGVTTMVFKVPVVLHAYEDMDADADLFTSDAEPRLEGVQVTLTHADLQLSFAPVTTDVDGRAEMLVHPGEVTFFASKAGYVNDEVEDDNDVDADGTTFTLTEVGTRPIEAGLYRMASIPMTIFMDVNPTNSLWDDNEAENHAPAVEIGVSDTTTFETFTTTNLGATDVTITVKPGTYALEVTSLDGSNLTEPASDVERGSDFVWDFDATTGYTLHSIDARSGQDALRQYAGWLPPEPATGTTLDQEVSFTQNGTNYTCRKTVTYETDGTNSTITGREHNQCGVGGTDDPILGACVSGTNECRSVSWENDGSPHTVTQTFPGWSCGDDCELVIDSLRRFPTTDTVGLGDCTSTNGVTGLCHHDATTNVIYALTTCTREQCTSP